MQYGKHVDLDNIYQETHVLLVQKITIVLILQMHHVQSVQMDIQHQVLDQTKKQHVQLIAQQII